MRWFGSGVLFTTETQRESTEGCNFSVLYVSLW